MPRVKKFKWSEEDYTLREFIDIFSHRLPVIFNIVEGWLGRDENHTFSSDEFYRIGAVKRQRRIVTEHGSGYYVSIPVRNRKKIDVFFPDGKVERSKTMADVLKAMGSHSRKTLSMMFENDKPVSFSFGPDQGANVNLGKMKIVDVYDERYLVGHSVWDGQLIDRKIPVAIPVYMELQVAPVVGLVGGTDEDYSKVLADIEEQMTDAVTDVDVFEEIILFPEDITSSDYEYIRPMATLSKSSSWSMSAVPTTQSAAYSAKLPPNEVHEKPTKCPRRLCKKAPPKPPAPDPRTSAPATGEIPGKTMQTVVSPVTRSRLVVLPTRPAVTKEDIASTLPTTKDDNAAEQSKENESLDDDFLYSIKPNSSINSPVPTQEHKMTTCVPPDIRTLSVSQLGDRLRTLKIPDPCVKAFFSQDVDGELLANLDEQILTDEFQFSRLNAIKLMKHVKDGYLPKF